MITSLTQAHRLVLLGYSVLVLAGCAGTQHEPTVSSARGLLRAADDGDGSGSVTVDVFDSMARVALGSDTVFLSRFDDSSKVVAAACTPVAGGPYDCRIGLP